MTADELDNIIGAACAGVLIFFPGPEIVRAVIGWLA